MSHGLAVLTLLLVLPVVNTSSLSYSGVTTKYGSYKLPIPPIRLRYFRT